MNITGRRKVAVMKGPELLTIEESHDKARVTRARPTDIAQTEGTDERRRRNHDARGRFPKGNDAARGRVSKHAVTKATARRAAIAEAKDLSVEPLTDEERVACDVMALFRDARRMDLDHDGPMVRAPAFRWAVAEALASYFFDRALAAGLMTPDGAALLDRADKAGMRAEKAAAIAIAADARLAKREKPIDQHEQVTARILAMRKEVTDG